LDRAHVDQDAPHHLRDIAKKWARSCQSTALDAGQAQVGFMTNAVGWRL
jgi:hypothetical protein